MREARRLSWQKGLPLAVASLLTACEAAESGPGQPPPLPEGAVSETFARDAGEVEPGETALSHRGDSPANSTARPATPLWGIAEGEPTPIIWDDLIPDTSAEALEAAYLAFYEALEQRYLSDGAEGGIDLIEEGSALDYMPQFGDFETVPDLDGLRIRIPGYVVPFDFNRRAQHKAFLLVPYMGACIHTPPPPPNQVIFVEADPAVRIPDIWQAYWLEGDLKAARRESDLADAAYMLRLTQITPYRQ